ncbi:flavin-containing monooxygenase [Devosia sp. CN2-171]|uniref:flavin-containing monooxygenase n=1 Tax=Devosia sp. CN2-171 TaxID=3400909 RepID=UPI003BF7A9BF
MDTMVLTNEQADRSGVTEAGHVENWLAGFEHAMRSCDGDALSALFVDECHWRDLVAFTWSVRQFLGKSAIVEHLLARQPEIKAGNFRIAETRTPPRRASRAGMEVIEAIFSFETDKGRASGLLRLPVAEPQKAWVLLTTLDELKGFEEPIRKRRRTGSGYTRNFAANNWTDDRREEQAYEGREPTVVVVGAGQAGLTVSANLRLLGVDTLIVERTDNVGDVWRNRYHALNLHNETPRNHLPYIPFPPNWPSFLSKDMIGLWFETYAKAMELNVWTGTELVGGHYDDEEGVWHATVRRKDGSERMLKPRHLIFANGVNGIPRYSKFPGIDDFKGTVLHTHHYDDGAKWKGKRALVIGTGASGHDVAQDLHSRGATVSLIQRGSTIVTSLEAAHINHALYQEDFPLEDSDIIAAANTYPLLIKTYQGNVRKMVELDKKLHAGLTARGFKHDQGEDGTGHQMRLRRRGGGYYLNVGCSDLIIEGAIGLLQYDDIERFVEEGALMKDGRIEKADLIVTATGYHSPQELVRRLLGDDIADRVGPIWGIAEDGEMNNMYRPTPQKGLWFMGGGLAQCRINSKPLALQIKAREEGLVAD